MKPFRKKGRDEGVWEETKDDYLLWIPRVDTKIPVCDVTKAEGPLTRDELAAHTGAARTALYDALMRLNVRGLIGKLKLPRETRGRCCVAFDVIRH